MEKKWKKFRAYNPIAGYNAAKCKCVFFNSPFRVGYFISIMFNGLLKGADGRGKKNNRINNNNNNEIKKKFINGIITGTLARRRRTLFFFFSTLTYCRHRRRRGALIDINCNTNDHTSSSSSSFPLVAQVSTRCRLLLCTDTVYTGPWLVPPHSRFPPPIQPSRKIFRFIYYRFVFFFFLFIVIIFFFSNPLLRTVYGACVRTPHRTRAAGRRHTPSPYPTEITSALLYYYFVSAHARPVFRRVLFSWFVSAATGRVYDGHDRAKWKKEKREREKKSFHKRIYYFTVSGSGLRRGAADAR